jgi:16S rRNA (guanine527-N7)-methyltransferase
MTPIPDRLRQRVRDIGIQLSAAQATQLSDYFELLRRWNPRINLTSLPLDALSPADFDRLLVEPIAAASLLPKSIATWFDLGSGGGSPAVPLKVVRPAMRLTMVETKSRKCAFLREAVRTVRLPHASVIQTRIEELAGSVDSRSADLLTIRGVHFDAAVHDACAHLLAESGHLAVFAGMEPPTVGGQGLTLMSSLELPTYSPAWLHLYGKA